jgi:hypothetical protein
VIFKPVPTSISIKPFPFNGKQLLILFINRRYRKECQNYCWHFSGKLFKISDFKSDFPDFIRDCEKLGQVAAGRASPLSSSRCDSVPGGKAFSCRFELSGADPKPDTPSSARIASDA